jgi:hypothetical protein
MIAMLERLDRALEAAGGAAGVDAGVRLTADRVRGGSGASAW